MTLRPLSLFTDFYLKQLQIMRFFSNPRKPMILALARPDPKKNITTLVKAFGEHRELRNLANLVCIQILCCLAYCVPVTDLCAQ